MELESTFLSIWTWADLFCTGRSRLQWKPIPHHNFLPREFVSHMQTIRERSPSPETEPEHLEGTTPSTGPQTQYGNSATPSPTFLTANSQDPRHIRRQTTRKATIKPQTPWQRKSSRNSLPLYHQIAKDTTGPASCIKTQHGPQTPPQQDQQQCNTARNATPRLCPKIAKWPGSNLHERW